MRGALPTLAGSLFRGAALLPFIGELAVHAGPLPWFGRWGAGGGSEGARLLGVAGGGGCAPVLVTVRAGLAGGSRTCPPIAWTAEVVGERTCRYVSAFEETAQILALWSISAGK